MLKHDVALKRGLQKQAGFTLIELLIVIAIIAILAAIAIPQFLKYKQGAYLDSVRSDVKNAVTALEAYQATNGKYPDLTSINSMTGPGSF
ncbi:MAG: type II secretion system protein, partial [Desulfurella sp.]|uniref:type II secretion system protein n=1 Tax=Desulfurella sp. TaxID=1962857 RepID=UPI003D0C7321